MPARTAHTGLGGRDPLPVRHRGTSLAAGDDDLYDLLPPRDRRRRLKTQVRHNGELTWPIQQKTPSASGTTATPKTRPVSTPGPSPILRSARCTAPRATTRRERKATS